MFELYQTHKLVLLRIFYLQLLATMVTYLVVLLQFQISIPDETQSDINVRDEQSENTTAPATEAITTTTIMASIRTTLNKIKKKT